MPELPEVETTARKLQPLVGRIIQGFWSDWPKGLHIAKSADFVNKDIADRKVSRIKRVGKAVVFELSDTGKVVNYRSNRILAFHQRMSGKLLMTNNTDDRQYCLSSEVVTVDSLKHVHARIWFEDGSGLSFQDPRKFGVVWYGEASKVFADGYFANLGPDALGISLKKFIACFEKRRGILKAVLLNQKFVAGIGNIVADETLWVAKIHPKRRVEALRYKEKVEIHIALQNVLRRSIKAKGTTLRDWGHPDGQDGGFQNQLRIYGRAGKNCLRCKEIVLRMIVGGRGTSFCPKCQVL